MTFLYGFLTGAILALVWRDLKDGPLLRAQQQRGDYWFARYKEMLSESYNPWKPNEND